MTIDCWPSITYRPDGGASGSFLDPDRWKLLRVDLRLFSELHAIKIRTFSETLTALLLDDWRDGFRGLAKEVAIEGYGREVMLFESRSLDQEWEWRYGGWVAVHSKESGTLSRVPSK